MKAAPNQRPNWAPPAAGGTQANWQQQQYSQQIPGNSAPPMPTGMTPPPISQPPSNYGMQNGQSNMMYSAPSSVANQGPSNHSGYNNMAPPPSSQSGYNNMAPPPSSQSGYNNMAPPPGSQSGGGHMPPPPPGSQSGGGHMPPPPPGSQSGAGHMPPPPPGSQSGAGHMPPPPGSQSGAGHMPPPPLGSQSGAGHMPPPGQSGIPGMPPPPGHQSGMGQMPPPLGPQLGYNRMPGPPTMPTSVAGGVRPSPGPYQSQPPPGHYQQGQQSQFQGPPMPGQQPMSRMPGPPAAPQQAQSRTLDPDQMPSAVQVMEEDRKKNTGQFETGQRGQAPPLVTTDFLAIDQGNCSPRYIRSTLYSVPCTADMLKTTQIPFGLVVSPMAEYEEGEQPLYISDLGPCGPVRCIRCKAYMSPYMTWIDGGRRFQCALCGGSTETPESYFAHLDHTGRRVDTYQRPELHLGSYEMIATTEYCKGGQLPNRPGIVFMIDVSYRAVKNGLTALICSKIKDQIINNCLPREEGASETEPSPLRVGFVTYDRVIHFYNLSSNLSQPQMMMVTDLEDVFVPLVDGFLVDPLESEVQIDQLLESIPLLFQNTKETDTVLGPVIESGIDAFKSAQCPGKLIVFHTGLPTAEAPGKLKNRDDRKLLGSDKEKTILTPQSSYYPDLAQKCVEAGVGVDMFVCCDSYVDLSTIGQVPFITGGSIYKYTYFQSALHGKQLMHDLQVTISNSLAFDCVMRVRTSAGTRPVDFFGGMYMANTTDVEMGVFQTDKAIALEIKHDDKLNEAEPVIIQCALLYTSVSGQRRLRIHNLALNSTNQMADTFRSAELDTMINLLSKMSLKQLSKRPPKDVRDSLISRCSGILAAYRKNCAANSGPGQLILPEAMKLLPLYTNAIIKNDALQGGPDISTDDRSYLMFLCSVMNVTASNVFFYPRLTPLHELNEGDITPAFIRCSVERLAQKGVYLLDNGIVMFLWLGPTADLNWINDVFGVASLNEINPDRTELPVLDNDTSMQVRAVIDEVRRRRKRHLRLHIVRARDKLEPWFLNFLVEDRGSSNGSTSYVDFLLHVHKEIRSLLN